MREYLVDFRNEALAKEGKIKEYRRFQRVLSVFAYIGISLFMVTGTFIVVGVYVWIAPTIPFSATVSVTLIILLALTGLFFALVSVVSSRLDDSKASESDFVNLRIAKIANSHQQGEIDEVTQELKRLRIAVRGGHIDNPLWHISPRFIEIFSFLFWRDFSLDDWVTYEVDQYVSEIKSSQNMEKVLNESLKEFCQVIVDINNRDDRNRIRTITQKISDKDEEIESYTEIVVSAFSNVWSIHPIIPTGITLVTIVIVGWIAQDQFNSTLASIMAMSAIAGPTFYKAFR